MKSLGQLKSDYIMQNLNAFCPGCGNGIILNCFVRAVDDLGWNVNEMLCVSGIGCSSWIPSPHFRGDTLHTTHGRALAFATGAKVFNSSLKTVVFTGDGDGSGIGGNHLIHAARRNIGITCILVNNFNYALTGGQIAPTTLHDLKTSTSPYGNPEQPFDIAKLVVAAGATYVARWTTNHVLELTKSIKEAMQNPGFSFIEILSQCPTQQRNIIGIRAPAQELPSRLLDMLAESTYLVDREERRRYIYTVLMGESEIALEAIEKALGKIGKAQLVDHITLGRVVRVDAVDIDAAKAKLDIPEVKRIADNREGKLEIGVFVRKQRLEYTEALREVGKRARGE
jgi:2-oxoglutarate/2-oxoacid ferredoxin oxidoreductase subunit beta